MIPYCRHNGYNVSQGGLQRHGRVQRRTHRQVGLLRGLHAPCKPREALGHGHTAAHCWRGSRRGKVQGKHLQTDARQCFSIPTTQQRLQQQRWEPWSRAPTSSTELVLNDMSMPPACVPAASRGWCPTGHHPTDAERSTNASGILKLVEQFFQLICMSGSCCCPNSRPCLFEWCVADLNSAAECGGTFTAAGAGVSQSAADHNCQCPP